MSKKIDRRVKRLKERSQRKDDSVGVEIFECTCGTLSQKEQ